MTVVNAIVKAVEPIRLLQITDCHLGRYTGEQLLGLDTDESLQDVIELVRKQQLDVDLLLVTGDVAGDGQLEAYQRFLKTYAPQLPQPMAWLPGNHDLPAAMVEARGRELEKIVELGNWVLILLNSQVLGSEHGDLTDDELQFLESSLQQYSDRHVAVFLHHQPVKVGSAWIDQYQIRCAERFFEILDRYSHVRMVGWGHVHQDFELDRKGVKLLGSPSTCVQFKPNLDEFTVDTQMPGYRWLDLHPDGRVETGIGRVAEKTYGIDFASSGY